MPYLTSFRTFIRRSIAKLSSGRLHARTMSDDDFLELMEMVEKEENDRNRDLGLDVMDVVGK